MKLVWCITELCKHPGAEDVTKSGKTENDLGVRVLLRIPVNCPSQM